MGFIFLQEFELNNLTVEFHKLLNYNLKIKLNKLKFKMRKIIKIKISYKKN